ncbi:MAG: M23 family metallopeptidase [Acidimicrobiales bacterium]|nr:M23 family metallopeptidase [Acidimicrobiales bacterium]
MTLTRRPHLTLVVALVCVALVGLAGPSYGQIFDGTTTTTGPTTTTTLVDTSTTTTTVPPSTTTTAPPATTTTTTVPPVTTTPDDASDGGGDGDGGDPTAPRTVPSDAQQIINSVVRSGPSSSEALFEAVQELVDLGLTTEEAVRIGFGRFPVAGVANYTHDWLFPRYGPGFRFHHGTDVFAPFGTPLRATVDGIATAKTSELGGLSVKVTLPDGTYFYYAHLSALAEGFESGMAVETGDIVGFVGDSGNAKGGSPHLHFGVFPKAGAPSDPKPLLDQWLAEATEALPGIIEAVRAERSGAPAAGASGVRTPRSLLATSLLRPLADRTAPGVVPTEVLYQTTGDPSGGGVSVVENEAQDLAASIDWDAAESRASVGRMVIERTAALVQVALGPFAAPSGETAAP